MTEASRRFDQLLLTWDIMFIIVRQMDSSRCNVILSNTSLFCKYLVELRELLSEVPLVLFFLSQSGAM